MAWYLPDGNQAITWTSVDFSAVVSGAIHLKANAFENYICENQSHTPQETVS